MRICVFGAGAVGSHFAVRLALAGHDVSCVMRGAHLDAVKANALTLRVGNGEFKAKVRASSDPATLGPQDAVICTLKATGLPSLAEGLPPLLGKDTAVVFAQNGVPWWYDIGLSSKHPPVPDLAFLDPGRRLRAAIPKPLIVGGVVFSSNEVVAPGVLELVLRLRIALEQLPVIAPEAWLELAHLRFELAQVRGRPARVEVVYGVEHRLLGAAQHPRDHGRRSGDRGARATARRRRPDRARAHAARPDPARRHH